MLRQSKAIFFKLCLLSAAGALGYLVLPREAELPALADQIAIAAQRPLADEQRRYLAIHVPGLFREQVSCLFQPGKGSWRTLLPGDLAVATREGADLTCTNGDKFHLHANTSARLWSLSGGRTFLEVEQGWLSGEAGKHAFRLGLGAATFDVESKSGARFLASAHEEASYWKCLIGEARLDFSRRMDDPLLLESGACRLDVVRPGEASKFTVAAGERTYLADIPLSPLARPSVPPMKKAAKNEAEIAGSDSFKPIALALGAPGAAGETHLAINAPAPVEDCTLFSAPHGHAPRAVKTYPALTAAVTEPLPAGARAPLFLDCRLGAWRVSSNFLLATKLAVASPEKAAPAVLNAPAPASVGAAVVSPVVAPVPVSPAPTPAAQ